MRRGTLDRLRADNRPNFFMGVGLRQLLCGLPDGTGNASAAMQLTEAFSPSARVLENVESRSRYRRSVVVATARPQSPTATSSKMKARNIPAWWEGFWKLVRLNLLDPLASVRESARSERRGGWLKVIRRMLLSCSKRLRWRVDPTNGSALGSCVRRRAPGSKLFPKTTQLGLRKPKCLQTKTIRIGSGPLQDSL